MSTNDKVVSDGGESTPAKAKIEPDGGGKKQLPRRRGAFNKPTTTPTRPKQPKFKGKCEDLKGHIFDCSDSRQADIYSKTVKEIAEYVGREYKFGNDVQLAIENLTVPTLTIPEDSATTATETQKYI
jgi:hypothetical protein